MEFRVLTKALKLYPYQHLFFSTHEYDSPKPVFPELASHEPLQSLGILDSMGVLESLDPMSPIVGKNILLLTGIASPEQMEHDLTAISPKSITMLTFGDHHAFEGHPSHQRGLQRPPLAKTYHHHRERCHSLRSHRGTERRGEESSVHTAHPHDHHAGPARRF